MNRKDLVRIAVLLDIADDYENTDHVVESLSGMADTCRVVFHRGEVLDALSELIQSGLAKAYLLSPFSPVEEIVGIPSSEQFGDDSCYFYITTAGEAELVRLRQGPWPFNDYHEFQPEFCPSLME